MLNNTYSNQKLKQPVLSDFDSILFERPVFKFQGLQTYKATQKSAGSFVYLTTPYNTKIFFEAQQQAFLFLSSSVLYELPASVQSLEKNLLKIHTTATLAEQTVLINLGASTLHCVSHYYHNSFTRDKSLQVYTTWIENSFSGYADHYAFIKLEHEIAGFITLKLKQDGLYIDLLVVNPLMRSQGIGKTLINYAIEYAHVHTYSLKVRTQADNIPANRLYQKEGFRVVASEYLFFKVEQ